MNQAFRVAPVPHGCFHSRKATAVWNEFSHSRPCTCVLRVCIIAAALLCLTGVPHSRIPLHVQTNWTFQGKLLCLMGVNHSREAITVRNEFGHSWLLLLCLTGVFIAALPLLPGVNPVIRISAPVPHGCFASRVFFWHFLQKCVPRPPTTVFEIGVPQRGQGSSL